VRFVIEGRGKDEQNLKELPEKQYLKEYITFLAYRKDVQSLMSKLDMVVLFLWGNLPLTPMPAYSVG
jgi:glycosyltransferase involved in cell wall biosynthesis